LDAINCDFIQLLYMQTRSFFIAKQIEMFAIYVKAFFHKINITNTNEPGLMKPTIKWSMIFITMLF